MEDKHMSLSFTPADIASLDLSWNSLYKSSAEQWFAFWAASKDTGIISLNLEWNFLGSEIFFLVNGLHSVKD